MDYETKERLKALRENMKSYGYIDGVEELDSIFPELRESEDESIRKELIEFIKWSVDRHFMREDFHQAKRPPEWIAYLEKQKERSLRDFIDDFPYSDEQKEQKYYWKPTETDVALFNKAVTTNKTLTPTERAQLDIIRSKFGYCRAVNCSGIVQKEQKPAEWNSEDEQNLNVCLSYIKDEPLRSWLKDAIHVRYVKPAEWSEEDEKIITALTKALIGSDSAEKIMLFDGVTIEMVSDWLKSPRPQPKLDCKDCAMFLNGECTKPHWKPSEHQMTILKAVKEYVGRGSGYWGEGLGSLIEDLEKL